MSIGKTAHCKISHWGKRSKRWLSRILRNTSCRCCKGWHARNCAIFAWLTLQSEPSQYIWWRKSFVCRIWVGRAEIVKLLIESRADVNEATTSEKGEGPLFTAADFGKLEVLALLLRANAEIDQGRLIDGATPLFVSAQEGDNEIGQTRIKVGLQTVKHHSERGELDVVRSLVQSGASINQVTSDTGMSGHLQAVEFFDWLSCTDKSRRQTEWSKSSFFCSCIGSSWSCTIADCLESQGKPGMHSWRRNSSWHGRRFVSLAECEISCWSKGRSQQRSAKRQG